MPLNNKRVLFKHRLMRVNAGVSDVSQKAVLQLVLVSPASKERKAVNVGAQRADEIARALEDAAAAIRREGESGKPGTEHDYD